MALINDQLARLQKDISKLDSEATRVMAVVRKELEQREGESQEDYSERMRPYLTHVDNLIYASLAKHEEYMRLVAARSETSE